MKPKISIITVTYNSAKTLEKTIQSIINQSFANYEFIIIDGGSNDGTIDIIRKYEKNIAYWVSEPDGGIYDAMNKGILKANGEWIHLLNSDDYYYDNSVLEKVSECLVDENNFYYFTMIQKNGLKENIYKWNSSLWKLWYSAYIPHPTMFVSKKAYESIGLYDTSFKIAADHDMILRLINHNINPIFNDVNCSVMVIGGASSFDLKKTFTDFKKVTIKNGLNSFIAECIYQFKIWKYRLIMRPRSEK